MQGMTLPVSALRAISCDLIKEQTSQSRLAAQYHVSRDRIRRLRDVLINSGVTSEDTLNTMSDVELLSLAYLKKKVVPTYDADGHEYNVITRSSGMVGKKLIPNYADIALKVLEEHTPIQNEYIDYEKCCLANDLTPVSRSVYFKHVTAHRNELTRGDDATMSMQFDYGTNVKFFAVTKFLCRVPMLLASVVNVRHCNLCNGLHRGLRFQPRHRSLSIRYP